MQLYRYKIDSVIYDAFDVNLTWERKNDVNPAIYRRNLSGSIKFKGTAFDYIDTTDKVYFDFSVEQLKISDGSWNEIWTGFFDKRYCTYDYNVKAIVINKYSPYLDDTDRVLAKMDEEINFLQIQGLTPSYSSDIQGKTESSITLNLRVQPYQSTHAAYRVRYDINGWPLNSAAGPSFGATSITGIASHSAGARTQVTFSVAHGLTTGHLITFANTTNYNKAFTIFSIVSPTIIVIDVAYTGEPTITWTATSLLVNESDSRWSEMINNGFISGVPQFQTMSFAWRPLEFVSFLFTEIWIYDGSAWNLENRYIKLPASLGATVNGTPYITGRAVKFGDFIDAFLTLLSLPLSFDIFTDITYSTIDYKNTMIDQAINLYDFSSGHENVRLSTILDSMANMNMFWYTDGGHLKFKHGSEIGTSGSIDLSAETSTKLRLTPIESSIPDVERWSFKDSEASRANGSTLNNNGFGKIQYTYQDDRLAYYDIREYNIDLYVNVPALIRNKVQSAENGIVLIQVDDDLSVDSPPYTVSGFTSNDYNDNLSAQRLANSIRFYRYWDVMYPTNSTKILLVCTKRPLFRMEEIGYQHASNEVLTDFNVNTEIITNLGSGKLYSYRCDLKTNKKTIIIDI